MLIKKAVKINNIEKDFLVFTRSLTFNQRSSSIDLLKNQVWFDNEEVRHEILYFLTHQLD